MEEYDDELDGELLRCPVCGSSECIVDESGEQYCLECSCNFN